MSESQMIVVVATILWACDALDGHGVKDPQNYRKAALKWIEDLRAE